MNVETENLAPASPAADTPAADAAPPAAAAAEFHSENADNSREGQVVDVALDPTLRAAAIDAAFDYRGDVTLTVADGTEATGYVANRDAKRASLTLLKADGGRATLTYGDITRVAFSGRDPAAGKTWENWLKRYVEQKAAGGKAAIESEHQE